MRANRAAGPLDVDAWYDQGRAVVEVIGEIDAYTAPLLRATLTELTAPARYRIAVEMSQVTFMDSSGLGVLVGAVKRAKSGGGGVALVGCGEHILRVLRVTGPSRVLEPLASLEEAFKWLDAQ